jgi:uncharacterized membrane protein
LGEMVGKESSKTRIDQFIDTKEDLIVILILLFGFFLRFIRISSREIAYDDAFSYFLASKSFPEIIQGTVADTMPPLYYFLLSIIEHISQRLWVLRSLNVVINMITIFLIFLIVKELFNKRAGYIAILLAAGSPFLIYHSQELRMYSVLLFGQVGYLFSLIKLFKNDSNYKVWILFSIMFGTIALYSHNLAISGLIACNFIIFLRKNLRNFYRLLFIQLLLLILFIPWMIYLPQQISKVQTAFWTVRPGLIEILQSILTLFGFAPMKLWQMAIVIIIVFQNLVIVTIWMIKTKNYKLLFLFIIGIASPALLFFISYIAIPVFVPRIFILSTVIACMVMGVFIQSNWNQLIGKLSLLSFLLIIVISLPEFYKYQSFPRSSFREATAFIQNVQIGEKIILHDNKLSYFPMMYYDNNLPQFYLADYKGTENDTLDLTSQKVLGHLAINDISTFDFPKDILFITFQQTELEFENLGIANPNMTYLETYYSNGYLYRTIGDINIYYYYQ